jgi:hypothetical protein
LGGPIQSLVKLSRSFEPEKPSSTIAVSIGEVKLGTPVGYLEIALLDAPVLPGYQSIADTYVGILFGANPLTPAPWSAAGSGRWHWVQLVAPMRFMTTQGQEYPGPYNGDRGLDKTYPYAVTEWDAIGGAGYAVGDAPGQELALPWTQCRIASETYEMFLMYRPPQVPGYLSRWVALKVATWWWAGQAQWNGTGWVGPQYPGRSWEYTGDFPRQPEWTYAVPPGSPD